MYLKTKILISLFLISNLFNLYSQKEAVNWYFGYNAGLNFDNVVPTSQKGKIYTREGCASISTKNGTLCFYTDGSTVWDRNHNIMPNGSGLLGHNSSTQSAIIVPKPGSNSIYYIFTVDNAEKSTDEPSKHGLNYTEVDMSLNNGKGDIVLTNKNNHLITYNTSDTKQSDWKCSEKIAAIQNDDTNFFWVVTHFVDTFYAFKITQNGVDTNPVISKTTDIINIIDVNLDTSGSVNLSAIGYLKISPDGKKLAIAHSSTSNSQTSGKVFLYNFNNETGKVSTTGKLLISGTYPYGLEFSPKSKMLYLSTNNYEIDRGVSKFVNSILYQYNLLNSNISSTKTEIYKDSQILAGGLQLAINGKIYRAKNKKGAEPGEPSLAAVNNPELSGSSCDYEHSAVTLYNSYSGYGLPPFISSFFLLTFDYEFTCLGDQTHFFITSEDPYDSLTWNFGDGTISNEEEPYHTYLSPGIYTVKLTTIKDGVVNNPVTKTVEIVDLLEVLNTPYELIECDTNDSNSNDGITEFNLQLANNAISLGNGDNVEVFYYNDLKTLESDLNNENSLPNIYRNNSINELIYAKVTKLNSDCYAIGKVILKTTESTSFNLNNMIGCDLGNNSALFNLNQEKATIINELNLSENSIITFHSTKDQAAIGYNPLEEELISTEKTIYVRIVNENICFGVGELNLEIISPPDIPHNEEINICDSLFPININTGISINEVDNYYFNWNSGETTPEIEILMEGEYIVNITDKVNYCSIEKYINVKTIKEPVIENIEIVNNSNSNTSIVHMLGDGEYLFSLNEIDGEYQNNNIFTNLSPGEYTVYVKDLFECEIAKKQFKIFGFPNFFTPNRDGINDYWEVKGLDFDNYTYSDIYIFNRFGKHIATINPHSRWDGFYNGKFLPSNDYWFTISVTDKENNTTLYKGHFSLIRK